MEYTSNNKLNRLTVDERLERLVEVLGAETVVTNINRMFDVDAATWFVEQMERDYDIIEEGEK